MAEDCGRPIEVEPDGDPGTMRVVVAGRWTWLGVGTWWALLFGAVSWLALEPPVMWFTSGTATVLALAAARLLVPRETLTLEADALVSRTGSRTTRLPLETIEQVKREFVPHADWDLWVGTLSGTGIRIRPNQETLGVCRELGRRLEPRRGRVRVADDAAAMLGWEPLVIGRFERRRIDVVVGSAPRVAVYRAVFDVLAGSAVQAVVGGRVVAREDLEGWHEFCEAVPWPERVAVFGHGREPLAVIEPACTTISALLTDSELAALISKLPPGGAAVPVTPPLAVRAARRLLDWAGRLVG